MHVINTQSRGQLFIIAKDWINAVDCNKYFSFQSFTNPLMDAPLLFLTAKAILVECEESLTVCQVMIQITFSS